MYDLDAYESMHNTDYSKLYSIDSEQTIIGTVLLEPDRLFEADKIDPEDMYRASHKIILGEILDMQSEGKQIDIALLSDRLDSFGQLEAIGGLDYLVDIARNTASTRAINSHIRVVKGKAKERRILKAAEEMKGAILHETGSSDERIGLAQAVVTEALNTDEQHDTVSTIGSALKSYIEDLDYRLENGEEPGLMTGLESLDKRWSGLRGGDFVLIGGRPGMGKTTALTAMIDGAARSGKRVYFSSLEMPTQQLTQRMIASIGGIELHKLKSAQLESEDWPKLTNAAHLMKSWGVVFDDQGGVDIAELCSRWRAEKRKNGLDLIMVDYLQLINDRAEKSRFDVVSSISRKLKAIAKELDVPIIVLSQLSRKVEERHDKRPNNADLRESGQLEQDADIICFVYRDEVYNEHTNAKGIIELITTKFRDGEAGTDFFSFIGAKNQIKKLEYDYVPQTQDPKPYKKTDKGF